MKLPLRVFSLNFKPLFDIACRIESLWHMFCKLSARSRPLKNAYDEDYTNLSKITTSFLAYKRNAYKRNKELEVKKTGQLENRSRPICDRSGGVSTN